VHVVAGPGRGGSKIALMFAAQADARRPLKMNMQPGEEQAPEIEYIALQEDPREKGRMVLPFDCKNIVRDKKVLLVDDVRNTGKTFNRSHEAISKAGGDVVATVEWYDRMNFDPQYEIPDVPNYWLAQYEEGTESWSPDECPFCLIQKKPITLFETS
jgi:hypoxanthine phosphoribosyltransferase